MRPALAATFVIAMATLGSQTLSAQSAACAVTVGDQVAQLINAERSREGLAPLSTDERLVTAACGHSEYMARTGSLGHEGEGGSKGGDRIDATSYAWVYWAENVAAGQRTPADVVAAWMDSPGHRANILAPDARDLGVGHVALEGTEYVHYWTVNFAAPQTAN